MSRPVAVLGAGAWGTALAIHLHQQGRTLRLWEYFPEYAQVLSQLRENPKFLPGIHIPEEIKITNRLDAALEGCREAVLAIPSQALRAVARRIRDVGNPPQLLITASKGIEKESLCRMSEVIGQELGSQTKVGVLSGPSHAEEVSRGMPCVLVAAAPTAELAQVIQRLFMNEQMRVYSSTDMVGVELGGALKNVIAIAAGAVDGLGLGDNIKAALITRGLAEMTRLGLSLGAQAETFAGLSGLGDLVVTCTSQHSRNRRVGEEMGRGRKLADILKNMEMVAEGIETSRSARRLAEKMNVDMPITLQVNRLLDEEVAVAEAVRNLMQRPGKHEVESGIAV